MVDQKNYETDLFGNKKAIADEEEQIVLTANPKSKPHNQKKNSKKTAKSNDRAVKKTVAIEQAEAVVSVLVPVPRADAYSYAAPYALETGQLVRVPLGTRHVVGIVVEATSSVAVKKLRYIDKVFDCPLLSAELIELIKFTASYTMASIGMVAKMALSVPAALDAIPNLPALRFTGIEPNKMTHARRQVLDLLRKQPVWTRLGLAHAAGVSASVIDTLKEQGVFVADSLPPEPVVAKPQPDYAPPNLSQQQAEAGQALAQAVQCKAFNVTLLEGVTGSGKTEVYFEAIAEALRQDKQVLVLLPEIALTQQVLTRFEHRFGAPPAAWHSGLSPNKREKIWRQVIDGDIRIVAGARSALFLPFRELGLTIVDEEHDASYKQEERIFYNARDMAVARGKFSASSVILSSATPSVETCVNVLYGRYQHVRLPARFGKGVMPDITVVDMRKNTPQKGSFLSQPLIDAVGQTLERQEQSLLFLNRRGYAPLTICRVCGHRFSCPDCSAWLVEHRSRGQLVCHHCDFHRPIPEACPECGTLDHLVPVGPGVERIAEEVQRLWPNANSLVLSTDNTQTIAQMRAELEAVVNGNVDIIIGTQLVAKGHHFPKMTLVGVVDADIGLSNGDLRASERSFQLLSQVTGRAGREVAQSRGLIQTYQPEHPVIQALAKGEAQAFIRREIEERSTYHLPPFGQLAAVIIAAKEKEEAEGYARLIRRNAPEIDGMSLLGPAEAPLARLRGQWRFRLLIQTIDRSINIQAYLRALLKKIEPPKSTVRVQIDIDPQSFL